MIKRGTLLLFIFSVLILNVQPVQAISYGISPPSVYSTVKEGEKNIVKYNVLRDKSQKPELLEVQTEDSPYVNFVNGKNVSFETGETMVPFTFEVDAQDLAPGTYDKQIQFVQSSKSVMTQPGVMFFLGVSGNLHLSVLNTADYHNFVMQNAPHAQDFAKRIDSGVIASAVNISYNLMNPASDYLTGISYKSELTNGAGDVLAVNEGTLVSLPPSVTKISEDFRLKAGDYTLTVEVLHDGEKISENKFPLSVLKRDKTIDYILIGSSVLIFLYVVSFVLAMKKRKE
ncbi:hypothetical protein COY25_02375 [Candidatus Uhrbacteria bacterium CG_4_10_14_0_2_um_filter_41_7]|nr:MAG: hypothetical protein COY25_02375 [Candidatus Uhrbacteria bacterium CG_4_10_14_0_2_um_filter_41_7]